MDLEARQKEVCERFGSPYQSCDLRLKFGISANVKNGEFPIHGLRIAGGNGTNGWFIWAGEWSDDPDFFLPLHGEHLHDWAKIVLPYLGLAKGWRFLISEDYEDVWEDPDMLK